MPHIGICNTCRNAEAEEKDKQGWIFIFFRGPLVALHVLGVIVESLIRKGNLILSVVTERKRHQDSGVYAEMSK